MNYNPLIPHGFNLLWGFGILFYIVFVILAVIVAVALIVLLARFLIIGTKAAQLYVSLNGPATPAAAAQTPQPSTDPAPTVPAGDAAQTTAPEPKAEPASTVVIDTPHAADPTPPDVRADDLVFSDSVIPPADDTESEVVEPTVVPPVKKPVTRAPRKPRTPPVVPPTE